jgi:integrase
MNTSKKQTPQFKQAQETLAKQIRHNRPSITDSSVKTYVSLLSNLYYREHSRDEPIDLSFFKDEEHIMDALKDKTPQSRKTVLAAIIVLNGKDHKHELLSTKMMADGKISDQELLEQNKTKKQEHNWEDYDKIKQLQNAYEVEALKKLSTKGAIDHTAREFLTRYMMLTLSSGVYFPPRRSEMIHIKMKDVDKEKDNYIDLSTNEIVYNQYKTVKKYGQQRVKFPPAFKAIVKKYLAKMSGQTYLLERQGIPFLATELTREMYKIFGKNISTSMLRHIYLSSVYQDVPALKEMEERAAEMGHSFSQAMQYVKK